MSWKFFVRQIGVLLLGLVIWFGGSAYIESVNENVDTSTDGVFFVDRFSINEEETGAVDAPFKNITDAMLAARDSDGPDTVIVAAGIYHESFRVAEDVTLIGNGEEKTIIENLDRKENYTIYLENNSALLNVTVRSGEHVIYIPAHTKAIVKNATIENGDTFGIFTEKSTRVTFPEYEDIAGRNTEKKNALPKKSLEILEELPLVSLHDLIVRTNKRQGLYLQDARVVLKNSTVKENGEEGIDLHPNMHATIINNDVIDNGESGLETEIQNNHVDLIDNRFIANGTNGVAFNSARGIGDMTLVDNTFTNNKNFGIRCVRQTDPPESPRPFFSTLLDQRGNIFDDNGDNGKEDFSFHCSEF